MPGDSVTLQAQSELLGPRPADQSRPLEFRRDPLRLLPRRQLAFRGVQEGPLRRAHGDRSRPLADRPTTSRRCATAASSRRHFPTACRRACQGLVFNTRRPIFADIRVREALAHAVRLRMDQPQLISSIAIERTASYFEGSELSARGRPADARERALLAPFPGRGARRRHGRHLGAAGHRRLGPRPRRRCERALALFDAGRLRARRHRAASSRARGRPFAFEILVTTRDQERLALAFVAQPQARRHRRAQVRVVDAVQYERRRITFDFDMIEYRWDQSLSPGNEQAFYWGSAAADAARHAQLHGRQKSPRSTP